MVCGPHLPNHFVLWVSCCCLSRTICTKGGETDFLWFLLLNWIDPYPCLALESDFNVIQTFDMM